MLLDGLQPPPSGSCLISRSSRYFMDAQPRTTWADSTMYDDSFCYYAYMHVTRKARIAGAVVLGVLLATAIFLVATPLIAERILTRKLDKVYAEQSAIFIPQLNAMLSREPSRNEARCYDDHHDRWRTHSICTRFPVYKYNPAPVPAASRQTVLQNARKLDELLRKNGWTADRPQDPIRTIEASVPTSNLAPHYVQQVPFHKNIGYISCNLEIVFSGPADARSPGAINLNFFSCQQNISYFEPQVRTKAPTGP